MSKLISGLGNIQEYMADVEVRAAHNVLEACAQTETIDKVIFTSSATAVVWREDRKTMELDLDERHWSDVNFCRKFKVYSNMYILIYTVNYPSSNTSNFYFLISTSIWGMLQN